MIPGNITREHVLQAITYINQNGVPSGRGSTRYNLRHDGCLYPPKYIVSLANRFANGHELPPAQFSGGREVNDFLSRFAFTIESGSARPPATPAPRPSSHCAAPRHNERCSDCKNSLIDMFRCVYGHVKIDHKIQVPARMDDYVAHPCHADLEKVLHALQKHRGHREFVRLRHLHRCDLYLPSANAIVEFDESQHFTAAREVALAQYPTSLPVGFDLQEWKNRCAAIDAKDNEPEFRDEQRAWYDSLRDFLPLIEGMSPTIRVFMGGFPWCSLDSRDPNDVAKFKKMLSPFLPVPHPSDGNVLVATVVIASDGNFDNNSRGELMRQVLLKAAVTPDVFLFPAGYFVTKRQPSTELPGLVQMVRETVAGMSRKSIVCFGVDGRESKDQVAAAVWAHGLLSLARKFHPTNEEKDFIEAASGPDAEEGDHSRIFEVAGKRAFLAVCYDGFGIRHRALPNPGVDLVLDLIHRFNPKGQGGSGDVYFAKHGLAGSSKQWGCPAFGAAVFFNRPIPMSWPTGVLWNQGSKSTQRWKYSDNPFRHFHEFEVNSGSETAVVKIYQA